jgi:hypothetical protein
MAELHLSPRDPSGKDEHMSQPRRPFFTVTDFDSLSVTTAMKNAPRDVGAQQFALAGVDGRADVDTQCFGVGA